MKAFGLIGHLSLLVTLHSTVSAFLWTHTPSQPTNVLVGSDVTLQWDFLESNNESLLFLVMTQFDPQSPNNESSLVIKVANRTKHVYKGFEGRVDLKDKATLVLYNVTFSDETSYCCQVFCTDTAKTSCIQLIVKEPPLITNQIKEVIVIENETLSLHCNATGKPAPLVIWKKSGASEKVFSSSTLQIVQAKRDDSGTYECIAVNGAGEASSFTRVDVHYPATVDISPRNITLNESDVALLYCNTTGNPAPNVTWFKKSDRNHVISSNPLIMWSVRGNGDEGDYLCEAWNGVGQPASDSTTLTVQHYKPFATTLASCLPDNTFWEDDTAALKCSSFASPPPTYYLYHNGKLIRKNRSGYYKICRIRSQHAGNYTCTPKNDLGMGETLSIHLTVYVQASPAVFPRHLNVTEGEAAYFTCSASGSPNPTVTWRKQTTSEVYSSSETLKINSTIRDDTGYYECATFNGVGSEARESAFLNVYYAPEIQFITPLVTVNESGYVNLSCQANGNPAPIIKWFDVKEKREIKATGEGFTGFKAKKEDSGEYECRATNQLGNDSERSTVTVFYKPINTVIITESPMDSVVTNHSLVIRCTANADPPVLGYRFYFGSRFIANTKDGTHMIQRMQPSDHGLFHCVPYNVVGEGEKGSVYVQVYVPPVIHQGPKSKTINEGDSLSLHCNSTGIPQPNITWSAESWKAGDYVAGENLFIARANRFHAGQYTCTARNGVGQPDSALARVTINYKPSVQAKIVVYSWMGHRTDIVCEARGSPRPEVLWSRNGTVIQSRVSDTEVKSTLVITPENHTDFGLYTCIAKNHLGLSLLNITVERIESPKPPIIRNIEVGSDYINISWRQPSKMEGGPPISVLVQVRRKEDPRGWVNCTDMSAGGSYCVFHQVQSNTTYVIRLFAHNVVGFSNTSLTGETRTKVAERKSTSKDNEDKNFIVQPLILAGIICGAGLILVVVVSVLLYVRHKRRSGGGDL